MTDTTKILCCRISWMPEYKSKEEKPFSYHRYILDQNTPYEALNFLAGDDGQFRGYVPVGGDADDNFGKINIARLGGARRADREEGVIVVFCAPHEREGGLRIVGFYRNATVLKEPEISDLPDRTRVTRVISKDAVLIPEVDRIFTVPGRHDGGFGQSSLWYGLNEGHPLRDAVLRYVENTTELPSSQLSVIEYRRRKTHERWEGRGSARRFIHQKGFRCEACNYAIAPKDQLIWGTGFELYHLMPWAEMQEGVERELISDDFAVLCATCHRAIHRSDHVSDVGAFRSRVLARRDV
ncbi:hypothetical protein [Mesorhizobium sp. LjRoot246]|uniref:hypothetical protein n=1 Tax=Mesorhizobium sp. LjRoot246 TaxID=3342294 RepID=UPI003ED07611